MIILDRKEGFLDKKTDLLKKQNFDIFQRVSPWCLLKKKMTSFDLWLFWNKEKFEFLDQNHGLTPLEKNNFLYFEKFVVLF